MTSKRMKAFAVVALVLNFALAGGRTASAQKQAPPRRGALRLATLRPSGNREYNPPDISNLTKMLREKLQFDVVVNVKDLSLQDPALVHYPFVYLQGQTHLDFQEKERGALRRHLDPGGGLLFVDASRGNADFDPAFRRFVAELMPDHPLVPIPKDDDFYTLKLGGDLKLADAKRTAAAGGKADLPDLEGVKVDGRWVIIYSKIDIGSAIQKKEDLDCKGYTHESALRIATNIVLYATLP